MTKIILYIVCTFLSAYSLTGINWNLLVKKDKNIEIRVLVIIISLVLGYLLTNFILDFTNL